MAQAVVGTAPQRLDWQAISNIMNGFAQLGHRPRSRVRCFSVCVYVCMHACIHILYAYTHIDTHTGRVCAGWRQARCGRTWKPPLSLCLQCPANNRVVCNKRLPKSSTPLPRWAICPCNAYTNTHTHRQTDARTHTNTYIYIHAYIQPYKHSHIHTNIHTCTHRLPTS